MHGELFFSGKKTTSKPFLDGRTSVKKKRFDDDEQFSFPIWMAIGM